MRLLSVLLLTGMLFQTFSRQLIMADFLINRDYISKVLCINRDQPEKHCAGKCHLKKQLENDNNRQQNSQEKSLTGAENQFVAPEQADVPFQAEQDVTAGFRFIDLSPQHYTTTFFHPPGASTAQA